MPLNPTITSDQEVGDTLKCMLADFKAYLLRPQVGLYAKPMIFKLFRDLSTILVLAVGNSHHHGLHRSEPSGQFSRVMLEQNAYKPLERAEHGPVQHDRRMPVAVLADVSRA